MDNNLLLCAWCPTFDRTTATHASHGMCPACAAKFVNSAPVTPSRFWKTLVLVVMLLVLGLLVSACSSYENPLAPAVAEVVLVPAALTLTTAGPATAAHEALLNVAVRDAAGKGVAGQTVTLTTTAGSFDAATVTTGITGTAQAILTTTTDASVTATSGTFSATVQVKPFPVYVPPPIIVAPPPPAPPVVIAPPPPVAPLPVLIATLTCTPAAHPTPVPCNVNVTYGGVLLPATAITGVAWNWGDGATSATTTPVATHPYLNAGSYNVFATVSAMTADGSKTATGILALLVP